MAFLRLSSYMARPPKMSLSTRSGYRAARSAMMSEPECWPTKLAFSMPRSSMKSMKLSVKSVNSNQFGAAGEKPKPSESGEYTVYCFATIGITPSNSKLFHQHWCTNMTESPLPIVS